MVCAGDTWIESWVASRRREAVAGVWLLWRDIALGAVLLLFGGLPVLFFKEKRQVRRFVRQAWQEPCAPSRGGSQRILRLWHSSHASRRSDSSGGQEQACILITVSVDRYLMQSRSNNLRPLAAPSRATSFTAKSCCLTIIAPNYHSCRVFLPVFSCRTTCLSGGITLLLSGLDANQMASKRNVRATSWKIQPTSPYWYRGAPQVTPNLTHLDYLTGIGPTTAATDAQRC